MVAARSARTAARTAARTLAGRLRGRLRILAGRAELHTLGLLLCVVVTAVSVQDRDGAHPVLALLCEKFSTIRLVGPTAAPPDGCMPGPGRSSAWPVTDRQAQRNLPGFAALPRRWMMAERTCSLAGPLPPTGAHL
ncbi:hypothetical protein GCM10020220_023570 [Nonomuraea rubra]